MKGKQKILLLVCSVIAVVSVSGMAAYALLKTVTETKTNVFASDKSISIDLTEKFLITLQIKELEIRRQYMELRFIKTQIQSLFIMNL